MKRMRACCSRWSTAVIAVLVLQTGAAALCIAGPATAHAQAAMSHCDSGVSGHAAMHHAATPARHMPQHDMSHKSCAHCDTPEMAAPAHAFSFDAPVMALLAVPAPILPQYAAAERTIAVWPTTGPPADTPLYLTTRRLRI